MHESEGDAIRAQVDALKAKLLDLSLRNKMLNHRPSRRLGIQVVGESSREIHRMLVEEGKRMTFVGTDDTTAVDTLPLALDSPNPAANVSAEHLVEDTGHALSHPVDQSDTRLTTTESPSTLAEKLRTIQREAQLAKDELGINTLFITLGALEWSETEQRSFKAPLIYVPVALDRTANGTIRVEHDGSDIGDNLPLRAKLNEFSLRLPNLSDDSPLEMYFDEVKALVDVMPGWTVHCDDIYLGFFNYEKYAMFRDLGGEAWPDGRKPWNHPDVRALLGGGYSAVDSPISDNTLLDDVRPVKEAYEVYDADSSQTLAMLRASAGFSMVIEGPPGTGKSQTITNVIAEAVAAGKKVLFVAAKRAAVDVVKRRLNDAGLGDMCLDLHDKLTNRRAFYAEIRATLHRSLQVRGEEEKVKRLDDLRERLNAHSRAANEPIESAGGKLTAFGAMANLARLPAEAPEDRDGRIPFEQLNQFTHEEIRASLHAVRALQDRLRAIGVPTQHAFWKCTIAYVDPALRLDLEAETQATATALQSAADALRSAANALMLQIPPTAEDVRVLRVCAMRASEAPPHDGIPLTGIDWKATERPVRDAIEMLRTRNLLIQERMPQIVEQALDADLTDVLRAYDNHAAHWYRSVVGQFRSAQRTLRRLLTAAAPKNAPGQHSLVRDVINIQRLTTTLREHEAILRNCLGVQWQGPTTDPEVLDRLLSWILELCSDIESGNLPHGILDFLSGGRTLHSVMEAVEEAERQAEAAIQHYLEVARLLGFPSGGCRDERWDILDARIRTWRASLPSLPDFIAYTEARQLVQERGLAAVVKLADTWGLASSRLAECYLRSYYTGVLREVMRRRPELRSFDRIRHEQAIAEFCSLDDFKLRYNRACVRLAHHRQMPSFEHAVGNLQLLKVQCELQRKQKPIRWIMQRAGEAVQRTKPVFMMSPLSVAIHLPPELPQFDIVVFDEASQIKPEDALSSIIRGKQVVVVGDTRQMPPTNFFDRIMADDGDGDDDGDGPGLGQEARKLESILSMMSAATQGRTRRPDLRWHYRSLHPSLIQPSNEMFYENRLIVFPSPSADVRGAHVGVVFHHHPDTTYEAGDKKRVNRREADIVADAVCKHVRECCGESLMVAAMNKPQADLIFDEVARRERMDPAAFAAFRAAHPFEPLDIKNLENVQGDERDVVFISVTYGRDASGVIRQHFGPLLGDGGERRLNVLISRARRRCEVFSNIIADDVRVDSPSVGLVALKKYLAYAASGNLGVSVPTGDPEESPFEEEVSAVLRARGYEVHTQVGCEGYRIDLAVVHPDRPGSYLLGIECDGATYHRARSARDRDKLRQRVLEHRGWNLHRIWSPDWWQNRDGEIERLVEAIEQARAALPRTEETLTTREPTINVQVSMGDRPRQATTRPYSQAPRPTTMASEDDVRRYMLSVVREEGPIVHELLIARLREAAGYGRAGRNIRTWLENMVASALQGQQFCVAGDAYYATNSQLETPRDWSGRPGAERKSELVPELELAAALRGVVAAAFGIDSSAAIAEAFRVLGFRRVSDDAMARGAAVLDQLVNARELNRFNGQIRVSES